MAIIIAKVMTSVKKSAEELGNLLLKLFFRDNIGTQNIELVYLLTGKMREKCMPHFTEC